MFTQQKYAKHIKLMIFTSHSFILKNLYLLCVKTPILLNTFNSSRDPLMKISVSSFGIVLLVLTTLSSAFANNSNATPKWYRYYNSQGVPTLSTSISEQHLQYGYDSLDQNMHLIRHFAPFSGQKYDQEKAQREQAIERKINERHLQETYISSDRAISQRDRELEDLDGQIKRGQELSVTLSATLNTNVTAAANLERQNKPIPLSLKKQLNKNKDLLNQSKANIAALKMKREQTSKQFDDAITTLKSIEQRGNR